MESYQSLYKRLGSHQLVRQARVQQEVREKDEHSRRVQEGIDSVHRQKLEKEYEIRAATNGPHRLQSVLEKIQPEVHELKRKFRKKSALNNDDVSTDILLRKSHSTGVLALPWQGLEELPKSVANTLSMQLNNIHTMKLMGNKLTRLPAWNRLAYRNLIELDASNNRLVEIPASLGQLRTLKKLRLRQNRLSKLPNNLCSLVDLVVLEISGNMLDKLPRDFGKLKNLVTLRVDSNNLITLPWSFQELHSLEHLDLTRNALQTLALIQILKSSVEKTSVTSYDDTWKVVTIPGQGTIYFNKLTGKTQRQCPEVEKKEDPWKELLPGEQNNEDSRTEEQPKNGVVPKLKLKCKTNRQGIVNKRKEALAAKGMGEWSCKTDYNTGRFVFVNNIFRTTRKEMPKEMDCFGRLTNLKQLLLGGNKLRVLPSSTRDLVKLQTLNLSSNSFQEIPDPVMFLEGLEALDISNNSVVEIPNQISKLTSLKCLMLQHNCVEKVSPELAKLKHLEKVWLMNNNIESLPSDLHKLCHLRDFQVNENPVISLTPVSKGDTIAKIGSDSLSRQQVHLLETVPRLLQSSNLKRQVGIDPKPLPDALPALRWHFKEQKQLENKGKPPVVRKVQYGIMNERQNFNGAYDKEEQAFIAEARASRTLRLHWRGLRAIPDAVFSVGEDLQELRLVGNRIKSLQASVCNLSRLVVLEMRSNALETVPDTLCKLECLAELLLDDNKLSLLPSSIGSLSELKLLTLSGNRLVELPESICRLSKLKTLHANVNRISSVPCRMHQMTSLEVVHLCSNALEDFPVSLCWVPKLQVLHLNQNLIPRLPSEMAEFKSLKVLHLACNRIKEIPREVCYPPGTTFFHLSAPFGPPRAEEEGVLLSSSVVDGDQKEEEQNITALLEEMKHKKMGGTHPNGNNNSQRVKTLCNTLEVLWLYSNQISQLCSDFGNLAMLKDIRLDFNQMASPPEKFALKYGAKSVLRYCQIRGRRLARVQYYLREANFVINQSHLTPRVLDLFDRTSTGFLTSKQLSEFESSLEKYLNRDFYAFPEISGWKLVEDLTALRARQRQRFLDTVLRKYLVLMEMMENDQSLCSFYYFNPRLKRRWGKNGALLDCFAFQLDALFENKTAPKPQEGVAHCLNKRAEEIEKYLNSRLSKLQPQHQPVNVFRFTEVEFEGEMFPLTRKILEEALTEFVDPYHGKVVAVSEMVRYKQKYRQVTRKVASAVVPKLLYNQEEADRCAREREAITAANKKAQERVELFLVCTESKEKLKKALKRTKGMIVRQISSTEVEIEDVISEIRDALMGLAEAKRRQKAFRKGSIFQEHNFTSEEEADEFVRNANQIVVEKNKTLPELKQQLKKLRKLLKGKRAHLQDQAIQNLTQKVVRRSTRHVIYKGRVFAKENKLRRPWDGKNGQMFLQWCHMIDSLEREKQDIEEEYKNTNRRKVIDPETAKAEEAALQSALVSVNERIADLHSIDTKFVADLGWSSDDSNGEPSQDEFELDIQEAFADAEEKEEKAAMQERRKLEEGKKRPWSKRITRSVRGSASEISKATGPKLLGSITTKQSTFAILGETDGRFTESEPEDGEDVDESGGGDDEEEDEEENSLSSDDNESGEQNSSDKSLEEDE